MTGAGDGPPAALRAGAHVVVEDLAELVLDDDADRHLRRSLRLRDGEALTATDGLGRWRACRWGRGGLVADGPIEHVPEPERRVTVAVAPPKGERTEWLVAKLTELGVDRIVLLAAARSVVRWDDERAERQLARLARVARSAVEQSRRCRLPSVEGVVAPADLVAPGVALADPDGGAPGADTAGVLIGPEGGWAPEERELPLPRVRLGDGVLRTETAAVAAGTLLCALRAGLVGEAP